MNNDNNQNNKNIQSLSDLYGTTDKESSSNVNPQIGQSINNISEPKIDNSSNQFINNNSPFINIVEEKKEDNSQSQFNNIPFNNISASNQGNNMNNKKVYIIIFVLVGIIFIAFLVLFFRKPLLNYNEQSTTEINNAKKGKDSVDINEEKKLEMKNILKKYTSRIDSYISTSNYVCSDDSILNPTTFYVEFDTSSGKGDANKNAEILKVKNEKSPWNNSEIKGYIKVEKQPRGGSYYYIRLSDNNHGLANEVLSRDFKESDITNNVSYPKVPSEGIKCKLEERKG